ncbi:thiol-disulfide isomerase/thioredoxin [Actinoplanes lutulentus]|uniref:Thiol-disulfide isomerase/thioredoxin n=1 Tax=Actinoplanes lutulentus TaxID=1287878 RepID=A0A327ZED8_9ACTN|nr:thioredoxin family protein [Actinoplanes lutulentus]MBB2941705.1 thiol-disulfide isomerase/thioredoxin [Actinoplanes lutulentus]RAK39625.1 thiol-disulfide isomerase/thioredoxin [Actinoplanes lutulentus]
MDPVGVSAVAVVLVAGVAVGLWRRRTDGRLTAVSPVLSQAAAPVAGAGSGAVGLVGLASSADAAFAGDPVAAAAAVPAVAEPGDSAHSSDISGTRLSADLLKRLGVESAPATLLQFSTAFCAPCRAVRRVSDEVAALLPGVQHIEVDAESHLTEVRELDVWRTPTLFVLDADGRVIKRATGVPSKPQLIATLAEILPKS